MLNIYLGNYLLRKGLLTSETLREMMDMEKEIRLRLGVLAMHKGVMTSAQVTEVNEAQKKVDARFGEIAIGKGFLTEEQLEELLTEQVQGGARLSQALIDKGIFTSDEMEKILNDYRQENNLSEEELEALKKGDAEQLLAPYIKLQCDLAEMKYYEAFQAYGSLFMRNLVRFIDHRTILDIENHRNPSENFRGFRQRTEGALSLVTYIVMDNETYYDFAEKHGKIPVENDEELAAASVNEFLNLHNGLFSVWASEAELPIKLYPPEKVSELPDPEKDSFIAVQFQTGVGMVMMMVASEKEK
ncbi:hypothetical protein [Tindallia californiensis]|uniref:Chemotaxis phosphatase CheX n=1 Tax=Tindallia californiensis TaxID=159292 RepID=A0A1H3KFM5_9FIRM|nr:hypothetical protein [Tindallia californiensis]SDY50906.1 hypothetical protein SAMN05192546_102340 [Tindallia californiensis]